jgi:UDP-GlcNAc:undecaprenyl-phosphate GlcNAc-1-phosphate transferase
MIWTQKTSTMLSLLVPLIALSVPLLDVTVAVARRVLRRQPIFSADRAHIHHRLLDRGLTPRMAVLVLYAFAAIAAALSLLLIAPQLAHFRNGLLVLLIAALGLGLRELRYKEFDFVGRWLFGGDLQKNLQESLRLHRLRSSLAAATTLESWWMALVGTARECGWSGLRWDAPNGRRELAIEQLDEPGWTFSVTLGEMGSIEIEGSGSRRGVDLTGFASVVWESAKRSAAFVERKAAAAEAR